MSKCTIKLIMCKPTNFKLAFVDKMKLNILKYDTGLRS